MPTTPNIDLPLPDVSQTVAEEFYILRDQTLPKLDTEIQETKELAASKAAEVHGHTILQIEGLVAALEGKMPAGTQFSLAGLTDVVGADVAPDGYVLVKQDDFWYAVSFSAAVGEGIAISQVIGLGAAFEDVTEALAALESGKSPTSHTHALNDLTDVDTATVPPVTGQGLVFNGTLYVPGPAGGGMFVGNNGVVGDRSGDIFRVNDRALTANVTIPAGKNASATGPISTGAFLLRVEGTLKVI